MKYLKYKDAIILCCGFPILGVLLDGIAYLVVKSDSTLYQLPPFFVTIIFLGISLPLFIAYFQFVELVDNKIIIYFWNIKTFEIRTSDIKQWGYYNKVGGRYVALSYKFIYISKKNFAVTQFDFTKVKSKKYRFIKAFPYDKRLDNWLKQNVPDEFL